MKTIQYYPKPFAILLLTILLSYFSANAQAPQKISYQSVIRDASGLLVSNSAVGIKISILQGSATGTAVYAETHTATTNVNGLVTIEIGGGTILGDSFVNINWANGPFYIKTETDPLGGTNYTLSGTSQLLSVPYALYASNGMTPGSNVGEMLYWNGTTWAKISGGTHGQTLSYCNGVPTWGPCIGLATLTTSVHNIELNWARIEGAILNTGGSAITAKGICYSTLPNPTTANTTISGGTGPSSFSCDITGLTPNTTYYVRSYATNSTGTAYGDQESFTTKALNLATITTKAVSLISHTTAKSGGSITNEGGIPITEVGICYATSSNPTIANTKISTSLNQKTNFTSDINNLTPNTTYYIRAYATNAAGTAYGNEVTFTTTNINTIAVLDYPDTVMSNIYFSKTSFLYPTKLLFSNLKKVNGYIYFDGTNNIVEVNLPVLDTLKSYFYFDNNTGLTKINAPSLKTAGGYVYVSRNTSLQQLNICNISTILCENQNSYYYINGNTSLVDSNLSCYAAVLQNSTFTTNAINQFSNNTALAGGTITKNCGSYSFGVCWSTNPNPTTNDTKIMVNNNGIANGNFNVNMTGLTPNTTYYVRAYSENSGSATTYGNQVSFTTLP